MQSAGRSFAGENTANGNHDNFLHKGLGRHVSPAARRRRTRAGIYADRFLAGVEPFEATTAGPHACSGPWSTPPWPRAGAGHEDRQSRTEDTARRGQGTDPRPPVYVAYPAAVDVVLVPNPVAARRAYS